MPTATRRYGDKNAILMSGREVKRKSFFKILPSATIVSVKFSVTAKAIGIFEAFLDISYANSTFSSTLA